MHGACGERLSCMFVVEYVDTLNSSACASDDDDGDEGEEEEEGNAVCDELASFIVEDEAAYDSPSTCLCCDICYIFCI